jgi:hypothetical protein
MTAAMTVAMTAATIAGTIVGSLATNPTARADTTIAQNNAKANRRGELATTESGNAPHKGSHLPQQPTPKMQAQRQAGMSHSNKRQRQSHRRHPHQGHGCPQREGAGALEGFTKRCTHRGCKNWRKASN